ncbi:alpha/beta hydrolase [Prosthecomicrobium sp. N25]|uniref:alpha/beta hydrolase n=1 Tax=Prosthecomicrobium sp. N25 TaxID=3129254 RepID=UPI0030776EBC
MPLRDDVQAMMRDIAAWQQANAVPPRAEQTVADMRSIYSRQAELRETDAVPTVAEERDATAETRAGHRRVRVFTPDAPGPLPVVVYVHGGGYVIGGIDETAAEARRLAAGIPAQVVSISYRLAPEHPWPAAIEDVEDQISDIAAGYVDGVPRGPLAVAGTSAGAGLAVAATLRLIERKRCPVALLALMSPCLDLTLSSPSVDLYGTGYQLERASMERFAELYVPAGMDRAHPDLSPARHPVPDRFPPTILFAAECDPLADDAALFARRLAEAGIRYRLRHVQGVTHGFNNWFGRLPSTAADLDLLHKAIAEEAARFTGPEVG